MYGWRARLGILIPSGIIAIEPEFALVTPKGVSCHYHRFKFLGGGENAQIIKDLKRAVEYVAGGSELIADVRPSVMAMTGTGVSFIGGYKYDQILIKKMRKINGNLPTTTTSTSVIDAFHRLGIKKVSVAMPYIEEVSRAAIKFIEDNGIQVLNAKWLNKSGFDIPMISNKTTFRLAMEVDKLESEALFISCTNLHTFELIEDLEYHLKKPVITSNQATIWNMLRLAGIRDKINGYGQLLSSY